MSDEDEAERCVERGVWAREDGALRRALEEFTSAIELWPSRFDYRVLRAQVHEMAGEWDRARADLLKAVTDPTDRTALFRLGCLFYRERGAANFAKARFFWGLAGQGFLFPAHEKESSGDPAYAGLEQAFMRATASPRSGWRRPLVEAVRKHVRYFRITEHGLCGACPLPEHAEKLPFESFIIHYRKPVWRCFACDRQGTLRTFRREMRKRPGPPVDMRGRRRPVVNIRTLDDSEAAVAPWNAVFLRVQAVRAASRFPKSPRARMVVAAALEDDANLIRRRGIEALEKMDTPEARAILRVTAGSMDVVLRADAAAALARIGKRSRRAK